MAHIHTYLEKLSRGGCGSFGNGNDLAISNRLDQSSNARRMFYQQAVDFEVRCTLLVKEYQGLADTALKKHCESESMLMARFNTLIRKYRTRSHSMLICTLEQIQEINAMCMSETLESAGIEAVFSEMTVKCRVREEIEKRVETLEYALSCEHAKLTESAFYCAEWQDSSSQTCQRAVVEIKETEDTKELKAQLQRLEKGMEEVGSFLTSMTMDNRKKLAQLWEFTHAHSYLINLYYGLVRVQKDVATTSGKENKIQTVNDWCATVQSDPIDHKHLAQVIQEEMSEDIGESEIKEYLKIATSPIAKNVGNVEIKIEEKQSVLFHLLEIVMSSAVKEKLFPADIS